MTFLNLRQRANLVRKIPLRDVLRAIGATPDRYDKAKWHTVQGVLSVTDSKFMNWSFGKGGGGAIDLAMHLNYLDFKAAVEWLWYRFPNPYRKKPSSLSYKSTLRLPQRIETNLPCVIRYLVHKRGIPKLLIDSLVESGILYADKYANAVFLLLGKENRPVGAELRGTSQRSWRGMAPGSNKNLGFFSIQPACTQTVVLCESAIDAISCFVLNPHCCCISTSGVRYNPLWLSSLIKNNETVYCGFDSDSPGGSTAQEMIACYPAIKRLTPPKHDWNDSLNSLL